MVQVVIAVLEFIRLLALLGLAIYGINCFVLTWLYLRHRHDAIPPPPAISDWPRVTVQLPIYNELHVVEQLFAAIGGLDYPRDRLEVQALDDATDETRQFVAQAVERLQSAGLDAIHITRAERDGFKAGALAAGLARASGELIAIFDADFSPQPDFLRRVVPYLADSAVGCVQARWGCVNRDYSLLTRLQALGVDGHFCVEQTARSRARLFLNFNGTAGMWRRECIIEAGGWLGDTLTEDLDLSYRAQLAGWHIVYLPDVVVPAELPAQISTFKRQQARWAQGSIQTALKMLRPLLRSGQPWAVRLEGGVHLCAYGVHPLMLLVAVLTPLTSFSHGWMAQAATWLWFASLGPPMMYAVAQMAQGVRWRSRLYLLPGLMLLGIGIALGNTWAVLKGVLGVRQAFERTPKHGLHEAQDTWVGSQYALGAGALVWAESGLAILALVLVASGVIGVSSLPWMLLYMASFGFVGSIGFLQSYQRWRWLATHSRSAGRTEARTPPDER